jgi:hypothetical protein
LRGRPGRGSSGSGGSTRGNHIEQRRIRGLNEKNPVLGNGADRRQIGAADEEVECVKDKADRGMVGAPDHLPGIAVIVDVPPPGERLERDVQAPFRRTFTELTEIGGGAVNPADRIRRNVAADQEEVTAEFLHNVKLPFGAREDLSALRLGHSLEIAERLEGDHAKPEILNHPADLGGSAVERQKIVLKDLHAAELRLGDCLELLVQRAAQRYGGNCSLHAGLLFVATRVTSRGQRTREMSASARSIRHSSTWHHRSLIRNATLMDFGLIQANDLPF